MSKPDPPATGDKNSVPHPFLPTSKLSKPAEPRGSAMNVADLPTFSPSLYPPSAFNYERPRHFIQSLPSFHTPDSEISKPNNLSPPASTAAPFLSPPQPGPTRTSMSSSMTLIPKPRSSPSNEKLSSAAFLSSVLPSLPSSQAKCIVYTSVSISAVLPQITQPNTESPGAASVSSKLVAGSRSCTCPTPDISRYSKNNRSTSTAPTCDSHELHTQHVSVLSLTLILNTVMYGYILLEERKLKN